MSTVLFFAMIVFQLAGGLILIFGQINVKDITFRIGNYYGSKRALDEQLKLESTSIYQIKYSNISAGLFLVIGYMCSFGADYKIENKLISAVISVIIAGVIVFVTKLIINIVAKTRSTIGLSVGATLISDDENIDD